MPAATHAQNAVYLVTGTTPDGTSSLDVEITVPSDIDASQTLQFTNYSNAGGNTAQDIVIPAGGIDSVVELRDTFTTLASDDDGFNGLDSRLEFPAIPAPLNDGDYVVRVRPFSGSAIRINDGRYALELLGPSNELEIDGFNLNGNATLDSLAFSADAGSNAEVRTGDDTAFSGTVTVSRDGGNFGAALYSVDGGTTIVGGVLTVHPNGTFEVNTGGRLDVEGNLVLPGGTLNVAADGVFDPDGDILVDGGTLDLDNTTISSNWNADRTLSIANGGTATTDGNWFLRNGQNVTLSANATHTHAGQLTVGVGSSTAEYLVTGTGTGTGTADATVTGPVIIGQGDGGGTGLVRVTGGGTLTQSGGIFFLDGGNPVDGNPNDSRLTVFSGGIVQTSTLSLAFSDGEAGLVEVNVDGNDSAITQAGAAQLRVGNVDTPGHGGQANVVVGNSGTFTTGTGLTTVNKTGDIRVFNNATYNANGDIDIVGGRLLMDNARFRLADDLTVDVSAGGLMEFIDESFEIEAGQAINITDGGRLLVDGFLDLDGGASLLVDGPASAVETNRDSTTSIDWGQGGAEDTVTIRNGGSLTVVQSSELDLAGTNSDNGSRATVRVESGGTFNTPWIFVAASRGGSADLTVTGTDSRVNLAADARLVIGSSNGSAVGTGVVTVENGGTIQLGTGRVDVDRTGTIEFRSGGDVATAGNINIDGGEARGIGRLLADTVTNDGLISLEPTDTDGIAILGNNYTQTQGGTLEVRAAPGLFTTQLTEARIFGTLTLAGELAFALNDEQSDALAEFGAVLPLYGTPDEIFFNSSSTGSSVDPGTFDTVTGHILGDGTALAVVYGVVAQASQQVSVQRVLYGDANRNGQIEQGDLNAVLNNWGQNNATDANADISWATGDFDGDGRVAQGDLNAVLTNWGSSVAPVFTGFTVPEPAALGLVGMGLASVSLRRRCAEAFVGVE
ncbi:MAG: PEP-CTERM sorting domain-containing protein [Planctomycetota bacterium]